jgi:hypothetical protein
VHQDPSFKVSKSTIQDFISKTKAVLESVNRVEQNGNMKV